ncbi:MAG: hypothetical protein FWC98_01370 [Bacteroidales bacterium]|nr:hypothetical protein [Bacteroidales bacterium]
MKKLKTILYILLVLLFLVSVIWTLQFAHRQNSERTSDQVRVFIDTQNGAVFITEDEIIQQLSSARLRPEGQIANLNVHAIESFLLQNSAIQNVNVFTQISGEVDIRILQRQPIVRIENAQRQHFFIGSDGVLMAIPPNHTARLLIANGNIFESFRPNKNVVESAIDVPSGRITLCKIYQLATYINNDEFLSVLISQIYVNSRNEFELVSNVRNQIILLGRAENFENQFRRLHHFYHQAIRKVDINQYRIINLKFDNQLIGTRL